MKDKSTVKSIIFTLIYSAAYFYIELPALNLKSVDFWFAVVSIGAVLLLSRTFIFSPEYFDSNDNWAKFTNIVGKLVVLLVAIPLIYGFMGNSLFTSSKRADVVQIETKDFYKDFKLTSPEKIPLLDRDTAENLGNRKLGELESLVSQYVPSDEYVQVNVKGDPYRVTPLEYAGFFKWLNNKDEGIGHYLKVNMYDGVSELIKLEENMKYSFSEMFGRDLVRHLRFNYPTTMFGTPSFEIDDEGKPYYIATTYEKLFTLGGKNPNGLLVVDPTNGEIKDYDLDNIPDWVDRVQSSKIIMNQINWNLKYQDGYFNSIFGKKGVRQLTDGYNYIPIGEDIYLYSGVTSANSDASNLGFILVNMRTKDVEYYPLSSAEEFSAMKSAEGSVQEKEYKATFPLLLNLDGEPLYVMSLKDNSGLVKGYSLVDVQDYQKVYTASSIKNLLKIYYEDSGSYVNVDSEEDLESLEEEINEELNNIQGEITQLKEVVKNGDTIYFFIIEGNIYEVNVKLNNKLPFIKENDYVEFNVNENGVIKEINLTN